MEPVPKSHVWRSTPHKGRTHKDTTAQSTGSRAHSVLLAWVMAWKFPASGIVFEAVGVLLVVVKLHSWLLGWNWLLTVWTAFKHTSCRPSTVACIEFSNLAEGKTFVLAFLRHKAGLTHTLDGRHTQGTNPQGHCHTCMMVSSSFGLTCMHHGMKSSCFRQCWVFVLFSLVGSVWCFGQAGDFHKKPSGYMVWFA